MLFAIGSFQLGFMYVFYYHSFLFLTVSEILEGLKNKALRTPNNKFMKQMSIDENSISDFTSFSAVDDSEEYSALAQKYLDE